MIVNIADSQTLAVKAQKHVPLVFVDPADVQARRVRAGEGGARCARRAARRRWATRTATCSKSRSSAAQASEVVRAAWSQYRAKANPDLRLLDLDKVVALIEAGLPDAALLRAAARQPVRHAREPGRAARPAARVLLGRDRGLLPGDAADRPRGRRGDVRAQRVRPARAGEHEPRHRSRHGAGQLRRSATR